MPLDDALDIMRPFAWLAALAFLAGFLGYLSIVRPTPALAREEPHAAVSAPASAPWDLLKPV